MLNIESEYQALQTLRGIIGDIKSKLNFDHAPAFSPSQNIVADYLKIQVRLGAHPFADGDGFYTEGPPPTILIDTQQSSPERLNFTFYHEITHHLIRQSDALWEFIHRYNYDNFERTLEHYCNIGAAEFLIPLASIREHIQTDGFSVQLIRQLDQQYFASKPAIAIQLTQAASHKCIILVCTFGVIPQRQSNQQVIVPDLRSQACLYTQYASSSPSCTYSCGRYVVIPKTHLIHDAFESGQFRSGRDQTLFKSGKNFAVYCEALSYRNQVFAEFRFSEPVSHLQMALL